MVKGIVGKQIKMKWLMRTDDLIESRNKLEVIWDGLRGARKTCHLVGGGGDCHTTPSTDMNLICWNYQGLGNPQTVRDLCWLVKDKRPGMVFLMETKVHRNEMETIKQIAGFKKMFVVDSVGRSGGLALLWSEEVILDIQNYSCRHINAKITSSVDRMERKFMGFYGHPKAHKRHEAWNLLRHLKLMMPTPWICVEDFNEILDLSKKYGGHGHQRHLMEAFQNTFEFCELFELDYRGPRFTWTNGREGLDFTKEKLDRVVANREWCCLYPRVDVLKEVQLHFDHSSMSIFLMGLLHGRRQSRGFRYEAGWNEEKECQDVIKKVWWAKETKNGYWQSITRKLERSKQHVLHWKKAHGRNKGTWVRKLNHQIAMAQDNPDDAQVEVQKKLKTELEVLLDEEDLFWRQRARENWLKEGDRNTKFFHA